MLVCFHSRTVDSACYSALVAALLQLQHKDRSPKARDSPRILHESR